MAMFFLRFQEYYESVNPEFRGRSFAYLDYISWYVQYTNSKSFSYPKDFIGYNIPSYSIQECLTDIPKGDKNKYDIMMANLHKQLMVDSNNIYYLIASTKKDSTFLHEIAHALYYIEPKYKTQMDGLTAQLSNKFKHSVFNVLATLYPEKVFNDELQAYLATDSAYPELGAIRGFKTKTKKYINVFQNWWPVPTL
jgi:hypothetical protein